MSATKYFMLTCDTCGHPTSGGMLDMRTTQRAVRRIAKQQGWARIPPSHTLTHQGRDVCPNCQPTRRTHG